MNIWRLEIKKYTKFIRFETDIFLTGGYYITISFSPMGFLVKQQQPLLPGGAGRWCITSQTQAISLSGVKWFLYRIMSVYSNLETCYLLVIPRL